jgi:hypothetical protein
MTFGELAIFAPADDEAGDLDGVAARLTEVTDGCALQVYRREPRSTYRPFFRPAGAP